MKLIRTIIFVIIVLCLHFIGCTPLKKQIYLQDYTGIGDTLQHVIHDYHIQPGDQLYIRIIGLDEKTYSMFNATNERTNQTISNETSVYINSYSVDDFGNINLPVIGKINILNMTINECQYVIQEKINIYIKTATVIVKHVNFKITVLGEVNIPRSFTVYNNDINILEAIGLAGDLTPNANRKDIKIIRKGKNSTSYIAKVDITNRDFTKSEHYYLQPNDIIYVEPLRTKNYSTNPFPITTILSIITTTVLTLNFIINN